jgi:hypothetical protein
MHPQSGAPVGSIYLLEYNGNAKSVVPATFGNVFGKTLEKIPRLPRNAGYYEALSTRFAEPATSNSFNKRRPSR